MLDSFAEAFAGGGLGALVFHNRNFGANDGEPRQEIDPWRRCATTATRSPTLRRPEVDTDRIGVWGSSYSGGHVLVLRAIDKRVKCVAAQVPMVSGFCNFQRLVLLPGGHFDAFVKDFDTASARPATGSWSTWTRGDSGSGARLSRSTSPTPQRWSVRFWAGSTCS